jgi:TolA-binding protein
MLHVRFFRLPAALVAACVLGLHAQEPPPNPRADEQFRVALSLLLNARVAMHAEAAREFQVFLKDFPADNRVPLAHFWLGECLVRLERNEDALREHALVADGHPTCERHAEALFRVGELSHRLARYEAAVQANARFLEQYPAHELAAAVRERDVLSRTALLQETVAKDEGAALTQAQEQAQRDDAVGQESLALLGTLLYRRGDFVGAAKACEEFLTKFPNAENLEEIRFNAASACLRLPDDARALGHLRGVQTHRPGEAAHLRGTLLLRMKQDGEAQAEFRRVVEKYPDSPFWSQSLFELGRAGDAQARATLIAKFPEAELADQTLCLWGSELIEGGKPEEALKRLEAVKPGSTVHGEAELLRAGALYQLGAAHEKGGAPERATKAYEELVAKYPKDRHAPYALLRLGALLLDKDGAAALRALERIGKEHPGFEHAAQADALIAHRRYTEALALFEAKQFDKAAPLFTALVDHAELGADATYTAALCHRNLNRLAEQEAMLKRLRDRHPDFKYATEVRRLLGTVLVDQRKWQEAATLYADWAAQEKEAAPRAEAQLRAGMALFQLNQVPRAKELLTAAAEHGEPHVKARATFTLGEMELGRKNSEEAKRLFLKVSVLYNDGELTPASMVEAAKCMRSLGDDAMARKLLEAVVKDYPESAVAAAAKALLQ